MPAAAKDPYAVLGVPRTASPEVIKKAYRKLARQLHPDINPDKTAQEKFKDVSVAFDILSDPKKKALYDEFGADGLRVGFNPAAAREYQRWRPGPRAGGPRAAPGGFEPGEIFGDFGNLRDLFGELFGKERAARSRAAPRPVEAEIEITLREAVVGGERSFTLGEGPPMTVRIPAGVGEGSRIRVAGAGERGGDLFLSVKLAPHPLVRREGHDLTMDLPITIGEAVRGASISVPTFEGTVKVKVPAGAHSGQKLRLRGRGVPSVKGGAKGDLYLVLQIQPPPPSPAVDQAVKVLEQAYARDVRSGLLL